MKTTNRITGIAILFAITFFSSCNNDKPTSAGEQGENAAAETEFSDADYSSGFVGSFKMTLQTFKNGTAESKSLPASTFYSNGSLTAVDMELPGEAGKMSRIIMNPADKTMTTLMDQGGEKMAMKMKMPEVNVAASEANKNAKVTETAETKKIEGYKCRKYIIESDDAVIESWLTRQIKGNLGNIFSGGQKDQAWADKMKDMKGFPLEIKSQQKGSSDYVVISISEIKLVDVDAAVFSTEGYEVQDMSNMGKMMEDMAKKYQQ